MAASAAAFDGDAGAAPSTEAEASASVSVAAPLTEEIVFDAVPAGSNAAKVWATLFAGENTVCGALLVSTIGLLKSGFGEAALRFSLKCHDFKDEGCLTEAQVWVAVTLALSADATPHHATHLRRAWRQADKYVKPEVEAEPEGEVEGEVEGEAAAAVAGEVEGQVPAVVEAAPEGSAAAEGAGAGELASATAPPPPVPAPPAPEEPKVIIESFLAQILQDEALAMILAKEHALPIEVSPEAEEAAAEDE